MAVRIRLCPGCGDEIEKGERACYYCLEDEQEEDPILLPEYKQA
jgi:PHP family Zn ribbon phosphoesterase